ncbi:MAG: hypothetical protein AB8H03_27120, partial [Saprospiraceae bacterium]
MKNTLFSKKILKMTLSKKLLKLLGTALCALLFLTTATTNSYAQNDVEIRVYTNYVIDFDALDASFDDVNGIGVTGAPITYNGSNQGGWRIARSFPIPTDVSEWDGVDMVFVSEGPNASHSQAQVDVMVEYVKQGGILVANFQDDAIQSPRNGINPAYTGQYLANTFICSDVYVMHTLGDRDFAQDVGYPYTEHERCENPSPYHPGEGNMNLTASGWDLQVSNGGTDLVINQSSWYVGVPPENAVLYCGADIGSVY